MTPLSHCSWWTRFWHEPVRAERLALFRVLLGVALLVDQLLRLLPHLDDFFGPCGYSPAGLNDAFSVRSWHWTIWLFNHDAPSVVYPLFAAWVGVTLLWTVGAWTRFSNVALWLLTMCFCNRNLNISNCGVQTLQCGLFLLMLSPCGKAFSVDAWWARRRGRRGPGPVYTVAWPLRVIQVQLCMIYLGTGLAKLRGDGWGTFRGSWWDGTAIHYVLNSAILARWSYAQFSLPLWITRIMTYAGVCWEVLFPALVLFRPTRRWALCFGVLFHLGIWTTLEVGGFSFFTLAFYGAWVPGEFWDRWRNRRPTTPVTGLKRTAA
jgi:hypothetical protein